MPSRSGTRVAAVMLALTVLAVDGCTSGSGSSLARAVGSSAGSSSSAPGHRAESCPGDHAAPDPARPRITLRFDVASGLDMVRGVEEVRFTPDLPIQDVVFRLTANGPTATSAGTSVRVRQARANGHTGARYEPVGADPRTQGGLLTIPLGHQVPAGQQVSARVAFTLTLGGAGFERFGHDGSVAWWGSGQPLFAWERGVGWHREPLVTFLGESATSETARMDLTVIAPADETVITSGRQDPPRDVDEGNRSWHAVADTARDASVVVGDLRTVMSVHDGVRIMVAAGDRDAAVSLRAVLESTLDALRARLGPFPYPVLNVTLLPVDNNGGIEYPSSILLFGRDRSIAAHEVAHQWFYGMVGNSQARDPWLDEAFASYAEQLVDGRRPEADALRTPGRVGAPTSGIDHGESEYVDLVYVKGSAALWSARDAAGAARFDAALRCYLNANAWRIARPSDLARALAGLPRALSVLRQVGAL